MLKFFFFFLLEIDIFNDVFTKNNYFYRKHLILQKVAFNPVGDTIYEITMEQKNLVKVEEAQLHSIGCHQDVHCSDHNQHIVQLNKCKH